MKSIMAAACWFMFSVALVVTSTMEVIGANGVGLDMLYDIMLWFYLAICVSVLWSAGFILKTCWRERFPHAGDWQEAYWTWLRKP